MYLPQVPEISKQQLTIGNELNIDQTDTADKFRLLKKLPAIFEAFFQKRIFIFPLYTTKRYFVIKSHFLLCFSKKESEEAYKYLEYQRNNPTENGSGIQISPHEKFSPKYTIDLETCRIVTRIKEEKLFIFIHNSWGKSVTLLTTARSDFDNMMKFLSQASIRTNKSDFKFLEVLGKGSFGEVTLVLHVPTGIEYAMKKAYIESDTLFKHHLEERAIFERVSGHPFVVNLLYAFHEERTLYYVQQYCSGGDLYGVLKRKGAFPEYMVKFYFAEILLALEHLHRNKIIHRDIKPENILLDGDGHALLTDFGLSKLLLERGRAHSLCGTELYYAPELYQRSEQGYDFTVDFWQLGCTIFELLTEKPPFLGRNKQERIEKILNVNPVFPETMSPDCVSLLQFLLEKSPSRRPSKVENIKSHPFFSGIDWNKLYKREVNIPNCCRFHHQNGK